MPRTKVALILLGILALSTAGFAQTTYRLHAEASAFTANTRKLTTGNTDHTSFSDPSDSLMTGSAPEFIIRGFETQSGVPNTNGTIPANSVLTFNIWMYQYSSGTTGLYPRFKVFLNDTAGQMLCMGTGTTALLRDNIARKYTLTCNTGAAIEVRRTDRFFLWVGTSSTGTNGYRAGIFMEGTNGGNYDSTLILPTIAAPPVNQVWLTYNLHREASTIVGTNYKLRQVNPDASAFSVYNSANTAGDALIASFESQSSDPNLTGVIPAGSTFSLRAWFGQSTGCPGTPPVCPTLTTAYPVFRVYRNNMSGTLICATQGSIAITPYVSGWQSFSCSNSAAVTLAATDRIFLWTGENSSGTGSGAGGLAFEGTAGWLYDSILKVPPVYRTPSITSLSVISGPYSTPVTITGTNFGVPQDTVKFNGTVAPITSWSNTQIVTAVPTGSTTGPVTVTTLGGTSNGVNFTVIPPPVITTLTPSTGPVGTPVTISGSGFATGGSPGTGSVAITGTEQSEQNCVYDPDTGRTFCDTIFDSGTVSITVNGFTKSVTYSSTSTSSSIATGLSSAFNGDSNSPVTTTVCLGVDRDHHREARRLDHELLALGSGHILAQYALLHSNALGAGADRRDR
jgi:hypothetical protein